MKNNEPYYGVLKALNAKMFRAVDAKRKHKKMTKYFDSIATYYKKQKKEYESVIMFNKTMAFANFMEMVENE